MVHLGKYNTLPVLKSVDFGIYLDGGEGLEILMPTKYVPQGIKVGDELKCFVYQDSEARLIATTETPLAQVGEIAQMEIRSVNNIGAFADWGTSKELLIPFNEQTVRMEVGRHYLVYVYIDHVSGRIAGSAKLDKWLNNVPPQFEMGEEVDALVWKQTPLGWKAIVRGIKEGSEHLYSGQIYSNQVYRDIHMGDHLRAWVSQVREDSKIDLMLQPMGYRNAIEGNEAQLLRALNLCNGYLPLTDKSDPAVIASQLHMSKRNFKQAVGGLYKMGRIRILPTGIELIEPSR